MNDNAPPPAERARLVPIVGVIHGDGQVTITDPDWRSAPRGWTQAPAPLFPNDPREP